MVQKAKTVFNRNNIAVASFGGVVISSFIYLLLTALFATMINGQTLAGETIKPAVPVILYLSHTIGGLSAALLSVEKKAIAAILSIAGSYFILTSINILFWDGTFDAVLLKAFSGLLAFSTVFLILLRGKQGRRPSRKYRSR